MCERTGGGTAVRWELGWELRSAGRGSVDEMEEEWAGNCCRGSGLGAKAAVAAVKPAEAMPSLAETG